MQIPGSNLTKFYGKRHDQGGILLNENAEVEDGEVKGLATIKGKGPVPYIFSEYVKVDGSKNYKEGGAPSIATVAESLAQNNAPQWAFDALAQLQEKGAGRSGNRIQVAKKGGVLKYQDRGTDDGEGELPLYMQYQMQQERDAAWRDERESHIIASQVNKEYNRLLGEGNEIDARKLVDWTTTDAWQNGASGSYGPPTISEDGTVTAGESMSVEPVTGTPPMVGPGGPLKMFQGLKNLKWVQKILGRTPKGAGTTGGAYTTLKSPLNPQGGAKKIAEKLPNAAPGLQSKIIKSLLISGGVSTAIWALDTFIGDPIRRRQMKEELNIEIEQIQGATIPLVGTDMDTTARPDQGKLNITQEYIDSVTSNDPVMKYLLEEGNIQGNIPIQKKKGGVLPSIPRKYQSSGTLEYIGDAENPLIPVTDSQIGSIQGPIQSGDYTYYSGDENMTNWLQGDTYMADWMSNQDPAVLAQFGITDEASAYEKLFGNQITTQNSQGQDVTGYQGVGDWQELTGLHKDFLPGEQFWGYNRSARNAGTNNNEEIITNNDDIIPEDNPGGTYNLPNRKGINGMKALQWILPIVGGLAQLRGLKKANEVTPQIIRTMPMKSSQLTRVNYNDLLQSNNQDAMRLQQKVENMRGGPASFVQQMFVKGKKDEQEMKIKAAETRANQEISNAEATLAHKAASENAKNQLTANVHNAENLLKTDVLKVKAADAFGQRIAGMTSDAMKYLASERMTNAISGESGVMDAYDFWKANPHYMVNGQPTEEGLKQFQLHQEQGRQKQLINELRRQKFNNIFRSNKQDLTELETEIGNYDFT